MNAVPRSMTMWQLPILAQANVHLAPATDNERRVQLLARGESPFTAEEAAQEDGHPVP